MSVFDHLMQEPIPCRRYVKTDPRGGKTYDPPMGQDPAIICGRLERKTRKIINAKGEETTSAATLLTCERLKESDLITFDGREWPVQAVTERKGVHSGTDHWEVMV